MAKTLAELIDDQRKALTLPGLLVRNKRGTVYYDDLDPLEIDSLMNLRGLTVRDIIGGRISPESRQNRAWLDNRPSPNQKHIYLRR